MQPPPLPPYRELVACDDGSPRCVEGLPLALHLAVHLHVQRPLLRCEGDCGGRGGDGQGAVRVRRGLRDEERGNERRGKAWNIPSTNQQPSPGSDTDPPHPRHPPLSWVAAAAPPLRPAPAASCDGSCSIQEGRGGGHVSCDGSCSAQGGVRRGEQRVGVTQHLGTAAPPHCPMRTCRSV